METLIRIIKPVAVMLLTSMLLLSAGCEDDEVTGDSHLKVINECNRTVTIYFDDTKLGTVSKDSEKTWDVPSGTHTVKATCYMAQDYEGTHIFNDGETMVITLNLQKKNHRDGFFLVPDYRQSSD